jgi:putative hydrolase of the HAD superfamily
MIGNSLKTDIKPALEIGIRAVHIPSEIEWDFNQIELDVQSNDKFYNLDQLKDLPSFIRTHSAD